MKDDLTTRLITLLIVFQLFLLAAVTVGFTDSFDRFLAQEKKRQEAEFELMLSAAITPNLFTENYAAIQKFVEAVQLKKPALNFVQVQDVDGHIVASLGARSNLQNQLDISTGTSANSFDLSLQGETIGTAQYSISFDVLQTLKAELINRFTLTVGTLATVGVIVLFFMTRLLTKGLKRLYEASEKMTSGQAFSPLEVKSADQIGQLTQRFNEMVRAIEQRTADLDAERRRLQTLLNSMEYGVLFESADQEIQYINPRFSEIWKLPAERPVLGHTFDELVDTSPLKITHRNRSRTEHGGLREECMLSDGRIVMVTHVPLGDTDSASGSLSMFEDVTARINMQEELTRLATRDSLTGLYNRHQFNIDLLRLSSLAERHEHQLALLFFDLDDFKVINDTYGHSQGDLVLMKVANVVSDLIRKEDMIYRLGGDEFALLTLFDSKTQALGLANKVSEAIAQQRHQFDHDTLRLTSSIGVSFFPSLSRTPEDLIAHADVAMYQAKARGKNNCQLYDPSQTGVGHEIEKFTWNEKLHRAFEKDLFELHYQGVYDTRSGTLNHLEALIRLRDEDDLTKLIPPAKFIPIAEKSGKILQLDRFVISTVVNTLASHPDMPPIAINISGKSFDDRTLPSFIGTELRTKNVDCDRLLIELTETEAVGDISDASVFIESLQRLGCDVCLDDFGTGFSSFSYLKHLKVDVLKIDGTFIQNLDNSYENQLFVESIVHVANGLGKRTIAEFVENQEILEKLKELGVDMVQGFHLDRPQKNHPAIDIRSRLAVVS